ncbi:hypothetical protein FOZ61_010650 [Perkinsus olseni]|uniref:Uncharacterized protein n=1 Tax=Perkinsus olseni TaxID=32597 RepID=A0A7J6M233_PEROL|nr:hypothetical protein FOZ61_010650 [Perkinsus olseni]
MVSLKPTIRRKLQVFTVVVSLVIAGVVLAYVLHSPVVPILAAAVLYYYTYGNLGSPKLWLILVYLLVDLSKGLIVSWSLANKDPGKTPSEISILFVKDVVSLAMGYVFAKLMGSEGTEVNVLGYDTLRFLPVAMLFMTSQTCALKALNYLDPGTFKLLLQVCLPTITFFSWCWLGRMYTKRQVLCVAGVFMFSILFCVAKTRQETSEVMATSTVGLIYTTVFVLSSCSGSILSEKLLKTTGDSLPVQVVHMKVCSVLIGFVAFTAHGLNQGLEVGSWNPLILWDQRTLGAPVIQLCTLVVVAIYVASGWLVAYITKRLSSTTKNVTQAGSTALTYALTMVLGKDLFNPQAQPGPFSVPATSMAVGIMACVVAYWTSPGRDSPIAAERELIEKDHFKPLPLKGPVLSNLNFETGQLVGNMVSPTFIGPASVQLPLTTSDVSTQCRRGNSPTNISSFHEISKIEDGHASCILGDRYYYYLYWHPEKLYCIPLAGPVHSKTIIEVPEPIADLRVVNGVLFLAGKSTSKLYMMVGTHHQFEYVMTMTSQETTDSASEGDDDDDPDWFPSPKFQDALIEDGRPVRIMYMKGGTWGKICVWQASGRTFETPERNCAMCRFVPRTGGRICFGVFENRYGERGYVYHIYDDLILSPNLFPQHESISSLYVTDDWTVCVSTQSLVVDGDYGLGLLRIGLNVFQLHHQMSATKFRDGRLLADKTSQS